MLKNHKKYNIRIVNISLGGERISSFKESRIDQLVEQLISLGVVIVAAVGNTENGQIFPPANSPHVIAVGGVDDSNRTDHSILPYHSTWGQTSDGFFKPELTAPAIWLAAPILPGTAQHTEACILFELLQLEPAQLEKQIPKFSRQFNWDIKEIHSPEEARNYVKRRITESRFLTPDYMHVDGTSFAAPIVSSVIAQLLEVNPDLTPATIRHILFSTARKIATIPPQQQGYGLIQPRKAVLKALNRKHYPDVFSPYLHRDRKTIEFIYYNDCAEEVALAGSFNSWSSDLLLQPGSNGIWKAELPMLPSGKYQYKFVIDRKTWVEDFSNPYREPDGVNGFNSILFVEH